MTHEIPSWLSRGYAGALTVYSIYRGHTGAGFRHESSGLELPSFLFKLDEIFEQFVRNSLRDSITRAAIQMVNGNQRPTHLFQDSRTHLVSPDAIIRINGRPAAIIEVKYKLKPSDADRYQVIAYTVAADAPLGILGNASHLPEPLAMV